MFKMTPDLCKKTIEELQKMPSFDLVSIIHHRKPKAFPDNFFNFIKYRAETTLESREDRWDARRQYESLVADRKLARAIRGLVAAVPEIATEKWFVDGFSTFMKG